LANSLARAEPPPAEAPPATGEPKADAVAPNATKAEAPPRNYVNLAMGGSTGTRGLVICAEVAPLSMLSVSACGSGSGFLNDQTSPEIAHFRANVSLMSWKVQPVWLQPRLQVGFAELQVGEDAAGFDFLGTGSTGMSTAGVEAGASLRGLMPIYGGVELVGELSLGLAYFPHAPELLRPQSAWQPSATMTVGVGF
jgi:hypothetical protein